MERFTCPDHGRLAQQLSLGRLDDLEAAEAEKALAGCASCAEWWLRTFESAAATAVDDAVAEGLAGFRAPRRAARRWWLAAAAAAVVSFGVGTMWWQQQDAAPTTAAEAVSTPAVSADAVLTHWSFEEGEFEVVEMVVMPAPTSREHARPEPREDAAVPVLESTFESGDLSGWSSHT